MVTFTCTIAAEYNSQMTLPVWKACSDQHVTAADTLLQDTAACVATHAHTVDTADQDNVKGSGGTLHSQQRCQVKAKGVPAGYFKAISKIARQERAKLYIPVSAPTTAIYDSLTQDVLPKDCVCWTLPPHLTGLLDDKTAFTELCDKVSHSVVC